MFIRGEVARREGQLDRLRGLRLAIELDLHLHLGVIAFGKAGVNGQVLNRDPVGGDEPDGAGYPSGVMSSGFWSTAP